MSKCTSQNCGPNNLSFCLCVDPSGQNLLSAWTLHALEYQICLWLFNLCFVGCSDRIRSSSVVDCGVCVLKDASAQIPM